MAEPGNERESPKSFYERSSFKATVAVVGLLSALWAFLGPPSPFQAAKELTRKDPLPLRNVEIILDASSRMGEPFGDVTKLDVAAAAVGRWSAAGEHVGLALRRAGGDCEERADPVVGFDDGQSAEIAEKAKGLEPEGQSNWGLAVRSAIGDFSSEEFQRPGSENQIVIFVGGEDQCGGNVGLEIRNELEHAGLHAQFRVFALKVSKKEQKSLQSLKRQLKSVAPVEINNAKTVRELYRAVQEDVGGGGDDGGSATPGGQDEGGTDGGGAGGGGGEAGAAEAGPEALRFDEVEPQIDEEPAVEPSPEEIEEREREELEEEEEETEELEKAEEKLDLEAAEEAPAEEPGGEDEEEAGEIEGSAPVPAPESRRTTANGRFSLRNDGISPITPSWTTRPSIPRGRDGSLLPVWGSFRGSWPSMP